MPLQDLLIKVDVPEGWEAFDYRAPRKDEWFLSKFLYGVLECNCDFRDCDQCVILRRKWVAPAWIKSGCWIYPFGGEWFLSNEEPQQTGTDAWWCAINSCSNPIDDRLFNFTPPPERRPYQIIHEWEAKP
jgi:hypothetical protein